VAAKDDRSLGEFAVSENSGFRTRTCGYFANRGSKPSQSPSRFVRRLDFTLNRLRWIAERLPDPAAKVALENDIDEHLDHLRSELECLVEDSLRRTIEKLRVMLRMVRSDDPEET
jgi:hypothetical protein